MDRPFDIDREPAGLFVERRFLFAIWTPSFLGGHDPEIGNP